MSQADGSSRSRKYKCAQLTLSLRTLQRTVTRHPATSGLCNSNNLIREAWSSATYILIELDRCQESISGAMVVVKFCVVIDLSAAGSNFLSTISLVGEDSAGASTFGVAGTGGTPSPLVTSSRSLIQMLPV